MSNHAVPQADAVRWMGLCPCGCGSYKVILLDEHGRGLATCGWDKEGWLRFMRSVLESIEAEEQRKEN